MSTNKDLFKKMLSKLNKEKSADVMFKPEPGEQRVRILPLKGAENPENPFQEVFFHWDLGGKTYVSPISYGERDPIAEFSEALRSEGRLPVDEFKAAMKFYPQPRTYVPVIVRGKESEGVKFWGFGVTTYKDLLAIFSNDEYGNMLDVQEGSDITITFTPKQGNVLPKTSLVVARKSSPLSTDPALAKKWLEDQPNLLDNVGKKWTFDELNKALHDYLSPEKESSAPSPKNSGVQATDWADNTPTLAKSGSETKSVSADVEAEFNALFNKE